MAQANLQPMNAVRSAPESLEEELRQSLYVLLQQSGGDPSQLLDLLAVAVEAQVWESLGCDFASFVSTPYSSGGLGWSIENLRSVLRMRHRHELIELTVAERMNRTRREIENLLSPVAGTWGGNRRNKQATSAPRSDREQTIARLKRDQPALAEKVLSGTLSVNQAVVQAGIRPHRLCLPFNDVPTLARALAARLSATDLDKLKQELSRLP